MTGQLTIICGPMFSGKTTELIRRIHRSRSIGMKVFVVHHQKDTRYDVGVICTHLQEKISSYPCSNLDELKDDPRYQEADILIIEEAQFYDSLYDFVVNSVDKDQKRVIVSGLDGNYKREPFPGNGNMDFLRLIPMADQVLKLNAYCHKCMDGTPAIFTHLEKTSENMKNIEENSSIILGGLDKYQALCRKHYLEVNSK